MATDGHGVTGCHCSTVKMAKDTGVVRRKRVDGLDFEVTRKGRNIGPPEELIFTNVVSIGLLTHISLTTFNSQLLFAFSTGGTLKYLFVFTRVYDGAIDIALHKFTCS